MVGLTLSVFPPEFGETPELADKLRCVSIRRPFAGHFRRGCRSAAIMQAERASVCCASTRALCDRSIRASVCAAWIYGNLER